MSIVEKNFVFIFRKKFCKYILMENKFKIIEHTADVGIKVFGKTLEELFENAAVGMYNIICSNFEHIAQDVIYSNTISEYDLETLLVSFLNDLLFQTFTNKLLFSKFLIKSLKIENQFCSISFECYGEKYQKEKHGVLTELKSATFHQINIEKINDVFLTTIIFDT